MATAANFPQRKYLRRLGALERLTRGYASTKLSPAETDELVARIQAKLVPNARGIRTKKDRSARGKFAR